MSPKPFRVRRLPMTGNLERKDLDVFEHHSKDSEMSSVGEMSCMVHEVADYAAPAGNWKERVGAAARFFGFGWERTKAFYYRDARRVEAEEMDHARREIARLRAEARSRRDAEHLAWLREQIDRHRASGEELRGPHILALEHVLRMAGDMAGTVVVRPEVEAPAASKEAAE